MDRAFAAPLLAMALAAAPALAQDAIAALGKQRAARSALQWDVREAGHPMLGPIRFAVLKTPISTVAGTSRISSNVYVSCERNTGKIAIELTNGTRPDDPGGLRPKAMPRLTCSTLARDGKPAAEDLDAKWIVNDLGDAMARGFWPSALRACASIGIVEEVVLPAAPRGSARVEFEVSPYARELDSIFTTCGEPTAYASAAAPSVAPPSATTSTPAVRPPPSAQAPDAPWIIARVTSEGHTNVRAKPAIRSPVVIRLDPGDVVLVQRTDGEWWHAKSRPAARAPFDGFIRRDRLVVK